MWISGKTKIFDSHALRRVFVRSMSLISDAAVDLSFENYGSVHTTPKPPVLILHGMLDSSRSWVNFGKELYKNTGRTVINTDARNHGLSGHASRNTYRSMANDVRRLLHKLNVPKISLIGHSMGGRTAMMFSLTYPERVSSLTIIDISPVTISGLLNNTVQKLISIMRSIDLDGIYDMDEAVRFVTKRLHELGTGRAFTKSYYVNLILRNLGVKSDGSIGWIPNLDVLYDSYSDVRTFPYIPGRVFPGATLFIGGQKSDFLQPEDLFNIKNYFPAAKMKYIPRVGHSIHEEDPNTLLKYVEEFYAQH